MLKNERQYNTANAQLKTWLKNLSVLEQRVAAKAAPDWLLDEERFGIEQQIKQLQEELQEYEDTVAGKNKLEPPVDLITALPSLLIKWRIARHWTQKELAYRAGIHENLLQKYESEDFSCASLQTLQKIAEVLQGNESTENMRS